MKKYSPIGELGSFAREYAESLAQTSGHIVCITDAEQVIAVSGGSKKEYLGKSISRQLENLIHERRIMTAEKGGADHIPVTEETSEQSGQVISPILCEGDAIGSVVMLCKDEKSHMTETEEKLAAAAAGFLGRQMEQ